MAGEQLFSKFVIKGGGKTFTKRSTILIFRQKPIRLIVVNAAVIETYTVKKCTNRSRCAHGIYSLTMILKKSEIITHRDKEREELLAIRNGKYLREDGSYAPEFFEFVDALEKKFQDDVRKTSLPAKPDFGKIEELLVEINKSYLRRIV